MSRTIRHTPENKHLRHPRTQQERRLWFAATVEEDAPTPRRGRSPRYLPTHWDDLNIAAKREEARR